MKYYIIAGEASGDLHGSNLIKGLLIEDKEAQFRFWGGDLMASASGERPVCHYKDGAVMGFTDVLRKAGKLLTNLSSCKKDIIRFHPDVVILIDYPGFNFRVAEFAHKKGFKVYYYIAPKTWASREGRNRKLKAYVDRLFIVFPFEREYFCSRGIPFVYAGNPLIDAVDNFAYSPVCEVRNIALLPGSRSGEISRMMPVCLKAVDILSVDPRFEGYTFIIAGAPSRSAAEYERYLEGRSNVRLVFGRTYDLLKYADAAVINSGTASLEAALIGTPQVVCWSTSKLTAFIARKLLRVLEHIKFISLGNLIVDKAVFKEFIQEDFTAENVAAELTRLTFDGPYRKKMLDDYAQIRAALGQSGASRAVAAEMIKGLR